MNLKVSLLVIVLIISISHIDARHKQKGGKHVHHRSKRTIGDIINWKLNLIQSILGGIGGLFGGGKKQPSRPSYGPPRPRPSYNGPRPGGQQRPPVYNNRPQGQSPRAPVRPQRPVSQPQPQYGPSNAIKMLPAPNLATGRPQVSGGDVNLGSSVLDTVTSVAGSASPGGTAQDSYGAPQGPVIQQPRAPAAASSSYSSPSQTPSNSYSSPVSNSNTYSSPSSSTNSFSSPSQSSSNSYSSPSITSNAFSSSVSNSNTYSSPSSSTNSFSSSAQSSSSSYSSPSINSNSYSSVSNSNSISSPSLSSSLPEIPTQYGSGATNTFTQGDPIIQDNSASYSPSQPSSIPAQSLTPAQAPDSYGGAIAPVLIPSPAPVIIAADPPAPRAPAPASDSYGAAISPVLAPSPSPVIIAADPPAPRAPVSAPDSYGAAVAPVLPPVIATTARSFTVDYDDYDPNDVPADQAADLPSYGISTPNTLATYGVASNSAFADDYDPNDVPADQAAPAPLPSYSISPADPPLDVYGSAVAPVGTSAPVPEDVLSIDGQVETSYDSYNQAAVIDLTNSEQPIEEIDNTIIDLRTDDALSGSDTAGLLPPVNQAEDFEDVEVENVSPTSAPVLFTYAPAEGSTVDNDLAAPVNILIKNPEDGGSLSDPLNVIPDEYEEDFEIEAYDQDEYEFVSQPSPAFDDLRGIQFTTAAIEALEDPEPTTYRAPIDFDLGTTASSGIEVGDVFLEAEYDDVPSNSVTEATYDDEYETEDETDYTPNNENIPIVTERTREAESLPSYDPVVLLVGTPEKETESLPTEEEDLPLYENALDARIPTKRKAKNSNNSKSKLRDLYNNWYGPRNDWSRKIAKVQGRIRFKKLNQKNA